MISFRFHLVSITAIFLALAAGIAIGAAVVDRASVDFLEDRLNSVEANRERTEQENKELEADKALWDRFASQAGDQVVEGVLDDGPPLLLVTVQGVQREPIDALRQAATNAGGRVAGTLSLSSRWRLGSPDDVRALSQAAGVADGIRADVTRRAAVERLAAAWIAGEGGLLLRALTEAGFADYDAAAEDSPVIESLPEAGTRFVVISSRDADVSNELLATPLTSLLARAGGIPLLAAEPMALAEGDAPPSFIVTIRGIADLATRLSTVDNIAEYRGRVAAVLTLDQLGQGRTGHFGIAPGATRLVPEPSPGS